MSLHHSLARDPSACRRLRWCAPFLLVLGLMALALVPGRIAGDRPFQTSLCGHLEQAPEACAQLTRAVLAAMHEGEADLPRSAPPAR